MMKAQEAEFFIERGRTFVFRINHKDRPSDFAGTSALECVKKQKRTKAAVLHGQRHSQST